jgi:hypothetical protein
MAPLLVVADVLLGANGVTLLPSVAREGLYLGPGDVVDVVHDEERDEVVVLGLDPDRDPARVRLRVASRLIGPGFEVWPSQTQSHVAIKRPPRPTADQVVALSGALLKRRA